MYWCSNCSLTYAYSARPLLFLSYFTETSSCYLKWSFRQLRLSYTELFSDLLRLRVMAYGLPSWLSLGLSVLMNTCHLSIHPLRVTYGKFSPSLAPNVWVPLFSLSYSRTKKLPRSSEQFVTAATERAKVPLLESGLFLLSGPSWLPLSHRGNPLPMENVSCPSFYSSLRTNTESVPNHPKSILFEWRFYVWALISEWLFSPQTNESSSLSLVKDCSGRAKNISNKREIFQTE